MLYIICNILSYRRVYNHKKDILEIRNIYCCNIQPSQVGGFATGYV